MSKNKSRQVFIAVVVTFSALLASTQSISLANAAITRALPGDGKIYSLPCTSAEGIVSNGQLAQVDISTGVQTSKGSGTGDSYAGSIPNTQNTTCAYGFAYNPISTTSYWINKQRAPSTALEKHQLFSITIPGGVSTYIGEVKPEDVGYGTGADRNITKLWGMTIDSTGNMWALWGASDLYLGKINQSTGVIATSSIISLSVPLSASFTISNLIAENPYNLGFNPVDNKLYTAGQDNRTLEDRTHLYEISTTTGIVSDLGRSGDSAASFNGLQFDSNGLMWGANGPLFSATVSGWSTPGDLQKSSSMSPYYTSVILLAPSSLSSPSAPTLNAVTAGDRSISVAFTAGANGGATITDYEYSLNGGTYVSAATTTSPFTITSGINGRTSYSVTLKARNSVGLSSTSGSLSATTTDSSADASEAAAAAAEAARVAAVNAALAAAAAKRAVEQKEMSELLAVLPSIAGLALSIGDLTNSLLVKQKCVKGKTTKYVKKGAKCPKGYVKRK